MTSKQKEATKKIQGYCAKYGKDSSEKDLHLSNFIVLEKYKLVYCTVPKVACTVWKRILANLEGYNITNGVHKKTKGKLKILSNYTTEDRRKILKTYKKFMFVREPFERLLSSYRDCFWGKFKRRQETWKRYRKAIRFALPNVAVMISMSMLITQLSNNLQPIWFFDGGRAAYFKSTGVSSINYVIHAKYSLIISAITKHCKMTHSSF